MPRAYTENRKASNQKWDAENLDRMSIALPKGTKDTIKQHITVYGDKSINAFMLRAITETIARDKEV